jgi:hypothetical protein
MAVTKDEIIEALKEMPALELSELVHELEDVFAFPLLLPLLLLPALLPQLPQLRRRRRTLTSSSPASAPTRSLSSRLLVSSPSLV